MQSPTQTPTIDPDAIHAIADAPVAPPPAAAEPDFPIPRPIRAARQRFDRFTLKVPDPTVHRDLRQGWLLPLLLDLDTQLWQRWDYWYHCCVSNGCLPDTPIPRIEFLGAPHAGTRQMLEASLNCIPNHGSWRTWGSWQYVNYLLDWLLFAFGHPGHPALPAEPTGCAGASDRLYQILNLDALLLWPHDYWGGLLGENAYGRGQGFYVTPHAICEMMTRMVFAEAKDYRRETMLDPCVGTGRFPLHASNYTLRLYSMDIDLVLCKATLVNAYCYAPWLARPIPWLDPALAQIGQEACHAPPASASHASAGEPDAGQPRQAEVTFSPAADTSAGTGPSLAAQLSNRMAEAAPPHAQSYLAGTEHDAAAQATVAPLLKRKRKGAVDPTQGSLF